jgi:hypothetical protein
MPLGVLLAKTKAIRYKTEEAAYWNAQAVDHDADMADQSGLLGCTRVTLKWNRVTLTGLGEDQVMTKFWFAKIAGTDYAYVPVAELATIEGFLNTFVATISSWIHTSYTMVEYAWHQFTENSPRTDDKVLGVGMGAGQKPGPAVRTTVRAAVGADASGRLPDQVTLNVTLRTASRRHWGRSCFPGVTNGSLQGSYGRWNNTVVDGFANAVNVLHDSAVAATYQMGVYSQTHPAFLTPKTIEADDVVDIQRRRRAKRTGYRKLVS